MNKHYYCFTFLAALFFFICLSAKSSAVGEPSTVNGASLLNAPVLDLYDGRQLYVAWWVSHEAGSTTEIFRSTHPTEGFVVVGTYTGSDEPFYDRNLKPRTLYYYKARSFKDGVYSDYSENYQYSSESEWFPPDFTAVAISPFTVELRLTDNSYQDDLYEIIGEAPGFFYQNGTTMTDSGRTATFTVSGLEPTATYYFEVDAGLHEEGGTIIDRAAWATVTMPFADVQIDEIRLIDATSVYLHVNNPNPGTWTDLFRSRERNGTYYHIATKPGDEGSFEDFGLSPKTTYYYQAIARRSSDGATSRYSLKAEITTRNVNYDPLFEARSMNETTIELRLTDNSTNDTKYIIEGTSPAGNTFYQEIAMPDSGRTEIFLHQPVSPGTTYSYTVNVITHDGETLNGVAEASATPRGSCTNTGSIEREVWNNITGTDVSVIPVDSQPSGVTTLTLFEAPANQGSNYGARVRGYICPPTTGNYTFWIASDDKSELWISTDESPANKIKRAAVNAHTAVRQWDRYTAQKSAPVYLEQGRRYYIEALHKEATGGDHLAVGWQLPDGTLERPIPGNRLIKLNATEACAGTGSIKWEVWRNETGTEISSVPFHMSPDHTTTLTSFESPQYFDNNYGSRASGYICPPETGGYHFWISSDDRSELWLSTDDDPINKVKIAWVPGYTPYGKWDKYPTQVSGEILLEAGRRYYVEVLHKESNGNDFISVGWQLPDGTMERPIPGNRLIPAGNPEHTAPAIIVHEPVHNQEYYEPAEVYIFTTPGSAEGQPHISKVIFYSGATKLFEDTSPPYEYSLNNVTEGNYIITAMVIDEAGNFTSSGIPIRVNPATCAEETGGPIERHIWRNIPGTSVSSIPVDEAYDELQGLFGFETQTYYANDYGSRVVAQLCVPTTGDYVFWISSDDNSELWLSSTDSHEGIKTKIASVSGYTNVRQWNKYASQQSAPIRLKAGYKYYIEALHKEANGNDHVEVGWQLPDGTFERPIPTNRLINYYYPVVSTPPGDARVASTPEEDDASFSISPNPVFNREILLKVEGTQLPNFDEAQVQVISLTGDVVHSETVRCEGDDCSDVVMTLKSDVQPGVYVVSIISKNKRFMKKLIVR